LLPRRLTRRALLPNRARRLLNPTAYGNSLARLPGDSAPSPDAAAASAAPAGGTPLGKAQLALAKGLAARDAAPSLRPLRFLFDCYLPEFYFLEALEMYRRILRKGLLARSHFLSARSFQRTSLSALFQRTPRGLTCVYVFPVSSSFVSAPLPPVIGVLPLLSREGSRRAALGVVFSLVSAVG
jgi:hypothetical protein